MKKDLPNLYRGNISNGASNNRRVAHANMDNDLSVRETINKLFKENKIYREDVELVTDSNTLTTKIIGRTQDHIITIDNAVIKIDNIKHIKILK